MLLELKRINLPPGQKIFVTDVNWQEFEDILEDLGEHRHSKIAYNNNTLEINFLYLIILISNPQIEKFSKMVKWKKNQKSKTPPSSFFRFYWI